MSTPSQGEPTSRPKAEFCRILEIDRSSYYPLLADAYGSLTISGSLDKATLEISSKPGHRLPVHDIDDVEVEERTESKSLFSKGKTVKILLLRHSGNLIVDGQARRRKDATSLELEIHGLKSPVEWKTVIEYHRDLARCVRRNKEATVKKLKSRRSVSFDEIRNTWLNGFPNQVEITNSEIIEFLENLISEGKAGGLIDDERQEFFQVLSGDGALALPQTGTPQVRETVVKEIVKIPCRYCGTLVAITDSNCSKCGAPLK